MQIRPKASEYNSYYATYINLVSDGNIVHILEQQIEETNLLLKRFLIVKDFSDMLLLNGV